MSETVVDEILFADNSEIPLGDPWGTSGGAGGLSTLLGDLSLDLEALFLSSTSYRRSMGEPTVLPTS